jgi:hypothetical protein
MCGAGISGNQIKLVRASMKNAETKVKFQTQLTEPFQKRQVLDWPQLYLSWLLNMSS